MDLGKPSLYHFPIPPRTLTPARHAVADNANRDRYFKLTNQTSVANVTPATTEKPSQQKLLSLDVAQLRSLRDVSLDFRLTPLTAIMGGNCSGKTTVLQALACAHRAPTPGNPDYKFVQFFRPNTDALWQGSKFSISYSQRVGRVDQPNLKQEFSKAQDRWSPRYLKRPERYTRFVGIGESVPDVDALSLNSMIHYQKADNVDDVGLAVREAAGQVLNRVYHNLYRVTYNYSGKLSIGVKCGDVTYSGLSMSSGEQRVFRILDAVMRAPNSSLILIDEIDLFLHQDALQRLLSKLQSHCTQKKKQLVFTTHFPPIAKMYDEVSIYTLNYSATKTVVWRGYSYEAMRHITGTQERPISCYVEDDVAEQIVARVAAQLEIRKFVRFGKYGPALNAFSLGAGLYLATTANSTLVVLDGDVYGNRIERRCKVKTVITGDQPIHERQRKELMLLIRTLTTIKSESGQALSPEQVLHRMLHGLDSTLVPTDRAELYEIATSVVNVPERHGFVNQIIAHTGESREVALSKIVELASISADWARYTRVVRRWLAKQKSILNL